METRGQKEYEFRVYPNDKSPKLFKSPILEVLTKTKLWIVITIYTIVSTFWISLFLIYYNGTVLATIVSFVLGFFSWTFSEYAMHRWVYHKISDSSYDSGLHYVFHGIHHEYPSDEDRIILPPVPGLIIIHGFLLIFYLMLGTVALSFCAGFLMGYLAYTTIHWMVHSKPTPEKHNFWWNHHNIHHYQQHDRAFGVSTPIWDYIFRTMPEKGRKTITILRKWFSKSKNWNRDARYEQFIGILVEALANGPSENHCLTFIYNTPAHFNFGEHSFVLFFTRTCVVLSRTNRIKQKRFHHLQVSDNEESAHHFRWKSH